MDFLDLSAFVRGHRRAGSDVQFIERTRLDALKAMNKELQKLIQTAPPGLQERARAEFDEFEKLFGRYLQEAGHAIVWDKIGQASQDAIKMYSELKPPETSVMKNLLNQLVVIKLNGGLGTSMGCQGPKSIISVRNDLTFLDLTVQQIEHLNKTYGTDVPLVLMNSFNTDEDTEKILKKYSQVKVKIFTFNQSRYPRISRESLLPVAPNFNVDNIESWYPPGHGDVYQSLANSNLLDQFIKDGRKYLFMSNIDNLGATVDLNILNFLLNPKSGPAPEFVMEVTNKTRADVKGGTLVEYDGKLRLLEIAQVPKDHVDEFKSVSKFKIFNTNNLWISLDAIKRVVEENTLHMEIIVNPKTLDNGLNVVQLETAVGAAIKSFEGAIGINVPRRRFLPVKTTSDLLIVMSNLYSMKTGALEMNPQRSFPSVPLVKLGSHFTKVKDFLYRFSSIPDMLELDHLTVSGDVTFGKNVTLKGTVIIIANHGDRIDIPSGAVLENKIVSGNLRILDH
ncbi:UTP--glucose-1-phosphate uridylyltransferase-like isoform X2 [Ostrea edulis]|uniref:UTP--glucose-1-phosphate uridylyltransferase-like isoform X2 n=1 Tax=Ostrea edulis TaxID=37623 RepID=UPI0020958F71|nr:UTP--glucose-1-phosphate uridylyltransferase-like isoform X2 [Ostrea edulis]